MRRFLLKSAGIGALVAFAICGFIALAIWALVRQNGEFIWLVALLPPWQAGFQVSEWLGVDVAIPVAVFSTIVTGALIGLVIGLLRGLTRKDEEDGRG